MKTMTQCRLERGPVYRREIDVAWIDSGLAELGRTVRFKIDGVWSEGWQVVRVGTIKPAKYVDAYERAYKTHRVATDI